MKLSFRSFLESEESKSPHLDALQDELGIDPKEFQKSPKVASFFSLGKDMFSLSPYKIMNYQRDKNGNITHAVVKVINDPNIHRKRYKTSGGKNVGVPDYHDGNKTYLVPIKDLQGMMTQGLDQQQAGGGDMMSPPGGGAAMPPPGL